MAPTVLPDPEKRPRLAPGCRLAENAQRPRALQMPERVLQLNGPSLEISSAATASTLYAKLFWTCSRFTRRRTH